MKLGRREFIQAAAAAAASGALAPAAVTKVAEALAAEGAPRVVWLQGSGCDGCAVSFLNSVHDASVDELLTGIVDLEFQSNLMAAAGDLAVGVADAALAEPGYILVVEGAIPTAAEGRYCMLWPGMSMLAAVTEFAASASFIVALGACASYGGVTAGAPNPTGATGVGGVLGEDPRLVNLPGCPAHPDWLVGTLATVLASGAAPPLDSVRRPLAYYGRRIHDDCFNRHTHCGQLGLAEHLSEPGCMELLGCKGKHTHADCPIRKWNADAPDGPGVNWCVGAHSPCLGCVEPSFPDGMSPFYEYLPPPAELVVPGAAPGGRDGDDDHH